MMTSTLDKQTLPHRGSGPHGAQDAEGGWVGDMIRRLCTYGPAPRSAGTYPVGVSTLPLGGMTLEVWYPTKTQFRETQQVYARLWRGLACRDAPVRGDRPWPLVVLSHGLRADRYDLSWLAEGLASEGYVVVAVDHIGSTAQDFDRREALKLWRRAVTLSRTISIITAHPRFAGRIDASRCAVAGHSAGGSTALVSAGARINPQLYGRFFPFGPQVEEGPFADERVRAVIALAPGTGSVFDAHGLSHVRVPVLMVSGTRDVVTPDKLCAEHYAKHIPQVAWHSLPDVGHYTFKPQAIRYGYLRARGICVDHRGVDRAQVHANIIAWTREFLAQHLG